MSPSMKNVAGVRRISATALNSAFPAKVSYVAIPASIPSVVRWSFILFIATIPFDVGDFTLMDRALSPAKMSGYLFFLSYLLYYNPFFATRSFPRPPHAMWWFLGYVSVYALNGFFLPDEFIGPFSGRLFSLLQLIFFFWIASDLLKDHHMARNVLLTYTVASLMLAVGIILDIPGFSTEIDSGRLMALGDNPNSTGLLMALSAVLLIGLSLDNNHSHRALRNILFPILTLPPLVVMVNTGSRAALVAFIIGCSVYLLPYWRSKRGLTGVVLALLGIVAVMYAVAKNPDSFERWQRTYYEGHLANRELIFPAAIEMFLERPIFGWQPVQLWHELGFRSGFGWRISDAHNLYLHLLLEVGLSGAIPFFVGLGLCGWAAWRARGGNFGLLPLALVVTLLADNMSGTGLSVKSFWLFLALALAVSPTMTRKTGQQREVYVVRRPLLKTSA